MKHASAETLARLEDVLDALRRVPGLLERKPGVFYRQARAFLHFHEDPKGLYADVRLDGDAFQRFALASRDERLRLIEAVRACVGVR